MAGSLLAGSLGSGRGLLEPLEAKLEVEPIGAGLKVTTDRDPPALERAGPDGAAGTCDETAAGWALGAGSEAEDGAGIGAAAEL